MNDMNKEANKIIDFENYKEGINDTIKHLPELARLTVAICKEYKKAGFTEEQAYDFAKGYVFNLLFNGAGGGNK